jgi:ankyrin repeat protein
MKLLMIVIIFVISCSGAYALTPADHQLSEAIKQLNVVAVTEALNNGADPNAFDFSQRGARSPLSELMLALMFKHYSDGSENANRQSFDIARLLFAKGAKASQSRVTMFSPIAYGNLPLIKLLVENGVSVLDKIEGSTPTHIAIKYKQLPAYELLISLGALPVDKGQALQVEVVEAANNCDLQGVNMALVKGASINGKSENDNTPLLSVLRHPLTDKNCVETAVWLLENGANPNSYSRFNDSENIPLHAFTFWNSLKIDIKEKDRVYVAASQKKILSLLLTKGAKVSSVDLTNKTALHKAAMYDNIWIAKELLKQHAKVMSRDNKNKTPLDYAESSEMITLLKKNGARE